MSILDLFPHYMGMIIIGTVGMIFGFVMAYIAMTAADRISDRD
jgi:hypothetical protein